MIHIEVASGKEIETIIKDDSVYSRIADDFSPSSEVFEMPEVHGALAGFVNDNLSSLYIVDEGKLHFMVLGKYRGYSRKLLEKSFNYYNRDVYCIIPLKYDDTIKFAINSGFRVSGMVDDYRKIDGETFHGLVLERSV